MLPGGSWRATPSSGPQIHCPNALMTQQLGPASGCPQTPSLPVAGVLLPICHSSHLKHPKASCAPHEAFRSNWIMVCSGSGCHTGSWPDSLTALAQFWVG